MANSSSMSKSSSMSRQASGPNPIAVGVGAGAVGALAGGLAMNAWCGHCYKKNASSDQIAAAEAMLASNAFTK